MWLRRLACLTPPGAGWARPRPRGTCALLMKLNSLHFLDSVGQQLVSMKGAMPRHTAIRGRAAHIAPPALSTTPATWPPLSKM